MKRLLVPVVAAATVAAGTLTIAPAEGLTANMAYSCGYWAKFRFGTTGKFTTQGCQPQSSREASANSLAPSRNLAPNGATLTTHDADGAFSQFGPAKLFTSPYDVNDDLWNSGAMTVTTGGTTEVKATAITYSVGPSPFWTATPTSWLSSNGPPWNDGSVGYLKAECTATSPTSTGSTVEIKNGRVDTTLDSEGYPATWVDVPFSPPAGYSVPFEISTVGDRGVMVFNERIDNGDGSFTINASHMYMQGPMGWGDVIISQVKCGHI